MGCPFSRFANKLNGASRPSVPCSGYGRRELTDTFSFNTNRAGVINRWLHLERGGNQDGPVFVLDQGMDGVRRTETDIGSRHGGSGDGTKFDRDYLYPFVPAKNSDANLHSGTEYMERGPYVLCNLC